MAQSRRGFLKLLFTATAALALPPDPDDFKLLKEPTAPPAPKVTTWKPPKEFSSFDLEGDSFVQSQLNRMGSFYRIPLTTQDGESLVTGAGGSFTMTTPEIPWMNCTVVGIEITAMESEEGPLNFDGLHVDGGPDMVGPGARDYGFEALRAGLRYHPQLQPPSKVRLELSGHGRVMAALIVKPEGQGPPDLEFA